MNTSIAIMIADELFVLNFFNRIHTQFAHDTIVTFILFVFLAKRKIGLETNGELDAGDKGITFF